MTISVAARKQKGRLLQQFCCQKISEITGIPWGPDDESLISSRPMGSSGVDVILRGKARKLAPFSIECKRQETWSIPAWIKQAITNEQPNTNWLLVVRSSHQVPVVVMDANNFFEMVGQHIQDRRKLKNTNTQNTQVHGDGKKPKKMLRTKPPNG